MPKAPRGAQAQLSALKGITADERNDVVRELDQRWCAHAFDNLQRAREATEAGKSFDARNWTWAAGVATDKVFAIREIPTHVVSNIHEHRHDISLVMDKLASAARVLDQHRRKGFAPVHTLPVVATNIVALPVVPVTSSQPYPSKG